MTVTEPFVVAPTGERQGPWKVLAGGDMTGGQAVFGDAKLAPGIPGPPRHVHTNEDEAFHVIEGVMSVEVDGRRFEAAPGTLVWLPRGHPHSFSNLSAEPVWVVAVILPSGLEGMFAEQANYFASLTGPPDLEALAAIAARYGVTFLGPPLSGHDSAGALAAEYAPTPTRPPLPG